MDVHDREIIAWKAVANAGISGSDVRDMMLEAVEKRSPYTVVETRRFRRSAEPLSSFTPVANPQSNGTSEAFVKTIKRDHVCTTPIPDAEAVLDRIAGWFEDYNDNHPHSGSECARPRVQKSPLTRRGVR